MFKEKSFWLRVRIGLGLLAALVASLALFDGLPFRVLIVAGLVLCFFEILSVELCFGGQEDFRSSPLVALVVILCLATAGYFFVTTRRPLIVLAFICTISTDTFAYLCGKAFHGKFFERKPFPKTSPNKTFEGIIGGVALELAISRVAIVIMRDFGVIITGRFYQIALVGGLAAVAGDYLASRIKRAYGIKDFNAALGDLKIEQLLGREQGHGGYLDRLDSIIFLSTIIVILRTFT